MSADLCNDVGDPNNFYFIYPAENPSGEYLDINDAVKHDHGQTPVCMLYLTHMVGQSRAAELIATKELRERHLFVLKMPNYEGKGSDAVILRYSPVPLFNKDGEAVSPMMKWFVGIMGVLGVGSLAAAWNSRLSGKTKTVLLLFALIALNIPIGALVKQETRLMEKNTKFLGLLGVLGVGAMLASLIRMDQKLDEEVTMKLWTLGLLALSLPFRVLIKHKERLSKEKQMDQKHEIVRALESRLMGTQFQKWQELSNPKHHEQLEPKAVVAGRQARRERKKSHQPKNDQIGLRRRKSEAMHPRTYRTRSKKW